MSNTGTAWPDMLQAFTNRNAGRLTTLEIDDPSLGSQSEELSYPLRGVTYDRRADQVEIMLGDLASTDRHLTHTIAAPRAIELLKDERGRDRVLWIDAADSKTRLRLVATP